MRESEELVEEYKETAFNLFMRHRMLCLFTNIAYESRNKELCLWVENEWILYKELRDIVENYRMNYYKLVLP